MARMPSAKWQPLAANFASQPKMRAYDIICIHTMVGGLIGTDGYFRNGNGVGYAGTESHFGTGGAGEIVQWQDTAYQAEANLNGNHHILSIENADMGFGFPKWNTNNGAEVPAFTAAQCEAISQIIAWACRTHNIPCELIPDAKPGRRGIGYHRQGVPGYMVPGAEKWSNATGKVCPGNRRVAQIPGIIARARQILNPPRPTSPAAPPRNPNPLMEDLMASFTDAEKAAFLDNVAATRRATDIIADLLMPGEAGVRFDGKLYERVRWLNEANDKLIANTTPRV